MRMLQLCHRISDDHAETLISDRHLRNREPCNIHVLVIADVRLIGITRNNATHGRIHVARHITILIGHRPHRAHAKQRLNADIKAGFLLDFTHRSHMRLLIRITNTGRWSPLTSISALDQQHIRNHMERRPRRNITNNNRSYSRQPQRILTDLLPQTNNELWNRHAAKPLQLVIFDSQVTPALRHHRLGLEYGLQQSLRCTSRPSNHPRTHDTKRP
ncbi:hypothetical protein cgR_2096 [Corynebacterium glutamicum R]|uniref:Uncharacterized protein n=1 Tax=Corynebacterium glutamicum (strain R) TaxID=340322 RepID=A0AB72VCF1_CORGB|nr:hypothetical protein cgR_2096 [Corynebacterium glutamicum R]